jgi:hypothetical protein
VSSPANAAPIPPQSLEAEESVLGALMLMPYDSGIVDELRDTGLHPGDFYRESHATIYRAALELQAERIDPDAIALADRLQQQGRLDTVGGMSRIHELAALVPATANAPHNARIVHEMGILRGLITRPEDLPARLGTKRRHAQPARTSTRCCSRRPPTGRAPPPPSRSSRSPSSPPSPTTTSNRSSAPATKPPARRRDAAHVRRRRRRQNHPLDRRARPPRRRHRLARPPDPKAARCLLIENEGPRGPFRRRLKQKVREWPGTPFIDNVHVLEEPWTRFTLTDPGYRRGLAKEIDRVQAPSS